jgi:hypothetical protein
MPSVGTRSRANQQQTVRPAQGSMTKSYTRDLGRNLFCHDPGPGTVNLKQIRNLVSAAAAILQPLGR